MFWWIIALIVFFAWLGGLDIAGLIIMFILFVGMTLGALAGVDRHRRHRLHPPNPYHPDRYA